MKRVYIFLTFVFLCVSCMMAQSFETNIAKVLTQDETLLSFNREESGRITGILASGNVSFTSPTGSVRILASDQYGFEALIYESYPSLAPKGGKDIFELMGFETGKVRDFIPEKIHVRISGAEVSNLRLIVSGLKGVRKHPSASLQARTKSVSPSVVPIFDEDSMRRFFIARLNRELASSGALWRAGDTPFSRLSYEEKKEMYGGVVPNFNGAEYYIGGIFEVDNYAAGSGQSQPSSYVPDFDWRTRHSATIKGSPYFQNEITGWITPVKDQGNCGSCWAFSAIGAMEAVAKLYRNTTYNFDLSEQELVSCSGAGSCSGGSASSALDYISHNRIQDEFSFPYKAQDRPCSEKGKPLYTIKNAGKTLFSPTSNEFTSTENLKSMLLKSPLAGRIGAWRHAMTLVGYKTIKAGDVVYSTTSTKITIQPGDPRIGKTAWIFKNSWGEDWGNHGFLYAFVNINNMVYSATPTLPFEYKYYPYNNPSAASPVLASALLTSARGYDRDNDGYYWWGIGPRPGNLPANAKWEEDSDDSDASIGPMNQYGFPTLLKDYDLYIKDNAEDVGFEPNTTIKNDNYWSAPQVWVRHKKDGIEEHQNPLPDKENYIYVRVWNRGQKKSPESKVIAYWAKAGTNLQWPEAWTGSMSMEGLPLGGFVPDIASIPEIEPGKSAIATISWKPIHPKKYEHIANEAISGKNLWHFCLLLKIADKNDPYVDVSDIRKMIAYNNNVAQKNLTIAKIGSGSSYEGAVSVINHLAHKEAYSLDVIELPNAADGNSNIPNSVFGNARVQLRMAPQVLAAWNEGGRRCTKAVPTSNPFIQEIVSSTGSIDNIMLKAKDINLVKMSVNFQTVLPAGSKPERHTILLRQKDKDGNVIGGETFEFIREPRPVLYPQIIEDRNEYGVTLSVTGVDEDAAYRWFDSKGKMIAEGAKMTCTPQKDETYKVEVTAKKDGYLTSSELLVKAGKEKMRVSPVPVKSELTVSYDLPTGEYYLCITGAQNQMNYGKYPLDCTKKMIQINVSDLPQGIYVATITERNGQTKESVKFIKE